VSFAPRLPREGMQRDALHGASRAQYVHEPRPVVTRTLCCVATGCRTRRRSRTQAHTLSLPATPYAARASFAYRRAAVTLETGGEGGALMNFWASRAAFVCAASTRATLTRTEESAGGFEAMSRS